MTYKLPRQSNIATSKQEARDRGDMLYNTGKPCKNGHNADRYLTGGCVACSRVHGHKRNRPWLFGSKHLQIDRIKEEQKLKHELKTYYDEEV
jgi:hypothetical protein